MVNTSVPYTAARCSSRRNIFVTARKLTACDIKRSARAYRVLRRLLCDLMRPIYIRPKSSDSITASFFEGTTSCVCSRSSGLGSFKKGGYFSGINK